MLKFRTDKMSVSGITLYIRRWQMLTSLVEADISSPLCRRGNILDNAISWFFVSTRNPSSLNKAYQCSLLKRSPLLVTL
jgi:hypothetical protein